MRASLVAQMVKNLSAMQETWVWSLGQKDPLEKGMATYSSSLAWEIPWTEEPGGLQFMASQSQTWLSEQAWAQMLTKFLYPSFSNFNIISYYSFKSFLYIVISLNIWLYA